MDFNISSIIRYFLSITTWQYIGLAFLPVVVWGGFFVFLKPNKTDYKNALWIFVAGLFSVNLVLFYHTAVAPYIRKSLGQNTNIFLVFTTLLVSLFFIVLIIVFVKSLLIVSKEFFKVFFSIVKNHLNFAVICIFLSALFVVELVSEYGFGKNFITGVLGATIVLAVIEEYIKHLIVHFGSDNKIQRINDAIFFSILVGLAFAFVENIIYFSRYSENLMSVFLYRSIFTALGHACFSGIFGYYYGIAVFSKHISAEQEIEKKRLSFFRTINKFIGIKKETSFGEEKKAKGLFLASLLHGVFNFLLEKNMLQSAGILIALLAICIVYLLFLEKNRKNYGLIGSNIMPEEDFKKLRMTISYLEALKKIKKKQKDKHIQQKNTKQ